MSLVVQRVNAEPVPPDARQHMVRMRDGVRLATDVYDIGGGEPAPTVLARLPYDKNSRYVFFDKIAERFTAQGYVVVVQDVRGKFRSQGRTLGWTGEVDDAYDTLEWITHQPWSDGSVGMFGDSYYGFTQWSAVSSQHPALRAIVPRVTCTTNAPGIAAYDPGSGRQPVWLEGATYQAQVWTDRESYEFDVDLTRRPVLAAYEEAFDAIGQRSAGFDLIVGDIRLDPYNGPHPYDARPVPVLHCVGWFDNLGIAHMRDYTELARRPGWSAVQYLIADTTDHENYALEDAPVSRESDHFADDAALARMLDSYTAPAIAFFDVFLKGTAQPHTLPRVRWKLGHAGWRDSDAWPPPEATTAELYLAQPAATPGAVPGGTLVPSPADAAEEVEWRYDPENLVPSAAPVTFLQLRDHVDERSTLDRDDVLVFTTPASERPLDLAGPVHAVLHVESTAPTYDVFVRLLDLAPDGAARLIVRGCAQSDAAGELEIALGHTGYRVRPGHRLALMIAGSDFPNHLPNSGSLESPWHTTTPKASLQKLRTGSAHPSRLRLTVLSPARTSCTGEGSEPA
ncbi:CocE/NonD family hydrolase [Streptomyces sp. YC504]|uniref:CocE/NonD family hydrolase n=1 Tax=Streptomyces mesophilus TaxID=1775132 RepID=A0A6G4XH81_9ACTN|nr:CocE/NonD family hydrolase [Streptomyces mesophilus]NGO76542.1 CocE/NonD family hydrolase [Streptomyces mesophilus]